MVENDTSTYHVNKPFIDQKTRVFHSLITQERTRKLELLIHLIANSRQALVVCGPQGIGKSTLLKVLQENQVESWLYCPLLVNATFSFEKIQEQIAQVIKQNLPAQQIQTLSGFFQQIKSQHKKIVLIIDDAGSLAPGLINKLIDYALNNPVLRVIFVLTHDELFIKNRSDTAIDDCHLIEIPPLSEKQCGEFLQYLATKPRSHKAFNAINDDMIEALYLETHGIPGRIFSELPELKSSKSSDNSLWILVIAVAGLVVLTLGIQWFNVSGYTIKSILTTAMDVQKIAEIETASTQSLPALPLHTEQNKQVIKLEATTLEQPVGKEAITSLPEPETNAAAKSKPETDEPLPIDNQQLNVAQAIQSDDSKTVNNKTTPPEQTEAVMEDQAETPAIQNDGERWLMTQPLNNYTLQVMVLSNEQAAKDFLKNYTQLEHSLKYIKTVANGKDRFVLLYGSFKSFKLANQAKKSLPPQFRKSIAREMSAIKPS